MFDDYYIILRVHESAGPEEIKKAYRDLAKKYHPDKNKGDKDAEEIFKQISMAYDTLSNPYKKAIYDQKREYYRFSTQQVSDATPPPVRKSSIYKTRKREYTPTAWMYGKIMIILIIMSAILIPYGIYHYSSVFHYEAGLRSERSGELTDAYLYYLKSISRWGARNLEASYRAGDVLLKRGSSRESISFFQSCYDYTNSDSVEAWIHFKLGIAYSNIGRFDQAIDELASIESNSFLSDSVTILRAEINTFRTRRFKEGLRDYSTLIDRGVKEKESWFGIGWCNQNLFQYPEAIEAYTNCLEIDPDYAIAVYYRGAAHYYNNDSIRACTDLLKAKELGYRLAETTFRQSCTDSTKSFIPPNEIL